MITSSDVCVLPAAFPKAHAVAEGKVGWRCEVTAKRGSVAQNNHQIKVHGAWFSINDTDRIRPITQLQEESGEEGGEESDEESADDEESGEESGEESDEESGEESDEGDKEGGEESEGAGEEVSNGSSPPPEDDSSDEDDKQ